MTPKTSLAGIREQSDESMSLTQHVKPRELETEVDPREKEMQHHIVVPGYVFLQQHRIHNQEEQCKL